MTVLAAAPAPLISANRRIFIMSALLLTTGLESLDNSFVPISFRDMIDDLDTSTSVIVWVTLGYFIAATGPMLFLARVGDRIGQARLFQMGTAVWALAMIACTWAPDVSTLIAFRMVQGLGLGMFLPATFSIGAQVYPESQRGRALGLLAAGNAIGFVLGPSSTPMTGTPSSPRAYPSAFSPLHLPTRLSPGRTCLHRKSGAKTMILSARFC
jgi:MFS family permease